MKIRCPVCGKETELKNNPWRPFCSKNCKMIDLWNWFHEYYTIKTEEIEENFKKGEENDKNSSLRRSRKDGQ